MLFFKYWLEIIVWWYWDWKSFYTHRSHTNFFTEWAIMIWNYTSPDFHIQFRSKQDLIVILKAIYDYKKDPKNLKQKIIIIIDEAPLYFNNRDFKNFPKELLPFLVQLRKLNVKMIPIAQALKMLDTNFRRLCYNVREYNKFLHFIRMYKDYELLSEDANLNDPINSKLVATRFKIWPWLTLKIFWKSNYIFGSSLYDTNELIIPYYNVIDFDRLLKIFPYTEKIESNEDYIDFTRRKELEMIKWLDKNASKYTKRRYKNIYSLWRDIIV